MNACARDLDVDGQGGGWKRRAYGPSVQVKTVGKPQKRTRDSVSLRGGGGVDMVGIWTDGTGIALVGGGLTEARGTRLSRRHLVTGKPS